jgi:hypothetical protein
LDRAYGLFPLLAEQQPNGDAIALTLLVKGRTDRRVDWLGPGCCCAAGAQLARSAGGVLCQQLAERQFDHLGAAAWPVVDGDEMKPNEEGEGQQATSLDLAVVGAERAE